MQFWKGESVPSACLDFALRSGTIGWVLVSRKVRHLEPSLGQFGKCVARPCWNAGPPASWGPNQKEREPRGPRAGQRGRRPCGRGLASCGLHSYSHGR